MPTWDSIYQQYQQTGQAWATLAEEIDPRFFRLLSERNFPVKRALDIGCGTGKYLALLESQQFSVEGIDSSPTAVEMTTAALSPDAKIQLADMYTFAYPVNRYDLIVSVSTIHHGSKQQVAQAIDQVFAALVEGGQVFITLPNLPKNTHELEDKNNRLAPGTYAPKTGLEEGLAHSFFTPEEVKELFHRFKDVSLDLDEIGRWFITATK